MKTNNSKLAPAVTKFITENLKNNIVAHAEHFINIRKSLDLCMSKDFVDIKVSYSSESKALLSLVINACLKDGQDLFASFDKLSTVTISDLQERVLLQSEKYTMLSFVMKSHEDFDNICEYDYKSLAPIMVKLFPIGNKCACEFISLLDHSIKSMICLISKKIFILKRNSSSFRIDCNVIIASLELLKMHPTLLDTLENPYRAFLATPFRK